MNPWQPSYTHLLPGELFTLLNIICVDERGHFLAHQDHIVGQHDSAKGSAGVGPLFPWQAPVNAHNLQRPDFRLLRTYGKMFYCHPGGMVALRVENW